MNTIKQHGIQVPGPLTIKSSGFNLYIIGMECKIAINVVNIEVRLSINCE